MLRFRLLFATLFLLVSAAALVGQQRITLEDIWQDYAFYPQSVPGFNFQLDGTHYTRQEDGGVVQYDLRTGKKSAQLLTADELPAATGWEGKFDDYEFSADEKQLLLSSGTEAIYRHSSQAFYFVYDRDAKTLKPVYHKAKHRLAALDPAGKRVAFVVDNDIQIKDLTTDKLTAVTTDGVTNAVINGATDWVYEEEFSFHRAFHWSPDGRYIAYYRFDESAVPEFTFENYYNQLYPDYVTFKYPKVGAANSRVSIHVYDTQTRETRELLAVNQSDEEAWHYVPRIMWAPGDLGLVMYRMNRHQNDLEVLLADPATGKNRTMLREKSEKYYLDVHDNLRFLDDGKSFLWTSERSGYNHIYRYRMGEDKPVAITGGDWEVTDFYGVDEKNGLVYFQAAKRDPMQREVYVKSLRGKDLPRPLAAEPGTSSVNFSATFDYFVLTHSTINTPPTYRVMDRTGKEVRMIEDNKKLLQKQTAYNLHPAEFFQFTTKDEVELNGYMIKPPTMVPGVKYPVLMFLYGGPGSQQVLDNFRGLNYYWFQMLAQQGFVVACVDNRGTGARGEEFKKMTYLELGKYETEDQIEAARYVGGLDYTDAGRIGVFGWSYGGYMSSNLILKGNDVFAAAIAVAPVTNWKWYDTIYTERYMRTEAENPDGYRDNSPVNFADRLKGRYLLVHGMGDDNVHFQHTAEMANALIMANKQFDTYFYPNRNHGIYGGPTRLHLYTKMTNFLLDAIGKPGVTGMAGKETPQIEAVPVESGGRE